ncbi:MAG: hypothetical protein ACXVPN_02820 [Bacteroidia bacterium]
MSRPAEISTRFYSRLFLVFSLYSLLGTQYSLAQSDSAAKPKRKLTFYGTWGYNRWAFTKSTIHFKNNGTAPYSDPAHSSYDFTLTDCVAHDSPDFDQIKDFVNITIPQFSVRGGFYFNNEKDEGWEINYDHAKYVVTDGQKVHVKGTILGQAQDKDTVIAYPYFHFEHTDGANFWQVNYIKRWQIYKGKRNYNNIAWIFKPGAGVVIPRTDVTIFGNRLNNRWHVAGFVAGVETGLRIQFLRNLCFEFTGKAAYADYLWCYVQYKGNGNANHRFGTVGAIASLGYQFHVKAKSK